MITGVFYELPTGEIVKTTGWNGVTGEISFYNEIRHDTILESKTRDWILRDDLKDFPNAKDPRLPYVFDLFWDIKYTSEITALFEGDSWWLEHDVDDIVEKLKENGLSHLIPENYGVKNDFA